MTQLYPSLIAANPINLERTITELQPYCHGFHVDIMDGQFCPNITFGIDTLHAIARTTTRQLWVHLMVEDPLAWIEKINVPVGTLLSFHFESKGVHKKIIKSIKEKKWRVGVAIKPKTSVEEIFSLLDEIDQVLIMSVEPGFSGQPFLAETVSKIDPLIGYRTSASLSYKIGMDGGINETNIQHLAHKQVDDLVIGSALFNKPNIVDAIRNFNRLVDNK